MAPAIISHESRHSWALQRFVAYSILVHFGGVCAWGIPALIEQAAEHERVQEVARLLEHFRTEEIKTKEHVRQQRFDATRREVEQALRTEFDALAAALDDTHRDDLWRQVVEQTRPQVDDFSTALGEMDVPEQNLRTLEAALHKAMIENLNAALIAESVRDLASEFLDRVESQVAPALASSLQAELSARITQPLHDEAKALMAAQRKAAQGDSDRALASLRSSAEEMAKASEAVGRVNDLFPSPARSNTDTSAKRKEDNGTPISSGKADAKPSDSERVPGQGGNDLTQAIRHLAEAGAALEKARSSAESLDPDAQAHIQSTEQAILAAQAAVNRAASAAQDQVGDVGAIVEQAMQAIGVAQVESQSALAALGDSAKTRSTTAGEAIRADIELAMRTQIEQQLRSEISETTVPRLAGKLRDAFAEELAAHGLKDDLVVNAVGEEILARLAQVAPAVADSANAALVKSVAGLPDLGDGQKPVGEGRSPVSRSDSALDRALAAGLATMASQAEQRIGELLAKDAGDAGLVKRARQSTKGRAKAPATEAASGESDAAATAALRDTIGSLTRSVRSGRLGSAALSDLGIGDLRQAALDRNGQGGGRSGASPVRNEALYADVSGRVAGRKSVHGEAWIHQGAQGEVSQAEKMVGDLPARVVGIPFAAALVSTANDQPYVPQFKTIAFTSVPYAVGAFAIDGDLAKWEAVPAMKLRSEHGDFEAEQILKMTWSQAGLFVYCHITDPNHHLDQTEAKTFWESDCIEIWIDAYNTKETFRARKIGQQFWIWPNGSASDPKVTGGEAVAETKGAAMQMRELRADRLERWSKLSAEGWVMEARIPAALITDADLAAGRIIGFNAYVNTMGGTDWFWSAGDAVSTSVQPDTWGDILLAGSDATIEVLAHRAGGAEGANDPTRVLRVGEPLRLRVSDGDMDLNSRIRDKVMVNLRGGPGGQQMAVLEETGVSTGIFEGAVTTSLALDEAVPAVLGVYEGDQVEAVYVDQARANGAREARVSTTVTFGSAVMHMTNLPKGHGP